MVLFHEAWTAVTGTSLIASEALLCLDRRFAVKTLYILFTAHGRALPDLIEMQSF